MAAEKLYPTKHGRFAMDLKLGSRRGPASVQYIVFARNLLSLL